MDNIKVKVADLASAPWRFSENRALAHQNWRFYTPILENIVRSLKEHGQLAPIHVRALNSPGVFEVVDGHIVVDAARHLELNELWAVNHGALDDNKARELYVHFNLNRCGQYGHYHVKIHRVFGDFEGEGALEKAKRISCFTSWPSPRILDYVELDERSDNWHRFMFVPKQEDVFDDGGEDDNSEKVPDWR